MKPFAIVVGILMLAGCASQPAPATPTPDAVTAAETCKQAGVVYTVITNAGLSHYEQRSSDEELEATLAEADVKLDEVDVEPSSEFEEIVQRLRDVDVSDYPLSMVREGSDEWVAASADLLEACESAGAPLEVNVWTGG